MRAAHDERGTSLTVAIYLDRWLSEIEGDIEPPTREFYRANVERYLRPALGDRPLDGLTVEELESTFDDLVAGGGHDGGPLDPTTVAKARLDVAQGLGPRGRRRRPPGQRGPPMSATQAFRHHPPVAGSQLPGVDEGGGPGVHRRDLRRSLPGAVDRGARDRDAQR